MESDQELTSPRFAGGPYVQVACFCDMVLEDKSGVLSLIRVIDTLVHAERGPDPPSKMPPVTFPLKLVLMLKSGKAVGRHEVKILPELPTGETKNPMTLTFHFEGEEKGHNAVVGINFTFQFEGLYWFRVLLDDEPLTAVPLKVRYDRVVVTSTA